MFPLFCSFDYDVTRPATTKFPRAAQSTRLPDQALIEHFARPRLMEARTIGVCPVPKAIPCHTRCELAASQFLDRLPPSWTPWTIPQSAGIGLLGVFFLSLITTPTRQPLSGSTQVVKRPLLKSQLKTKECRQFLKRCCRFGEVVAG